VGAKETILMRDIREAWPVLASISKGAFFFPFSPATWMLVYEEGGSIALDAYVHICIYIWTEREREKEISM